MGSCTHIVDDRKILNQYEYDAWGNVVNQKETIKNRFKFNGQQLDPITQQYYLRARFYNPIIARFTQEDTYRGDGLNLYTYCANNPIYYVDPSGNACEPSKNILDNAKSSKITSNNQIEPYEVTTYADFRKRSVVGDSIEGHELWQFANLKEHGYASSRVSNEISRNNPVIALPREVHLEVNRAQYSINPRTQTPLENIKANTEILYSNPNIPNSSVDDIVDMTLQHLNNIKKNTR